MTKPLFQSLFIHLFLLVIFIGLTLSQQNKSFRQYNFDIIEAEVREIKKSKPQIVVNANKKTKAKKRASKVRKVFGVKRKALTQKTGTVRAKIGNTVTKKQDKKVLRKDEADSLPEPAEEYLITSMPRPTKEIRPEYPRWAKEQGITGSVIFEILIDKEGVVRTAILVKSLHPQLDQLAKEAILQFKFRPGYIEKKPAAVRIKYAIKFILES